MIDLRPRRRKNDQKILEELYRLHGEALRCFLLGRLGCEDDIDDVIQDVFSKLAQGASLDDRYREGFRKNRAYIFTAANNLIIDRERHNAVKARYAEEKQSQPDFGVEKRSPCVEVVAREQLAMIKEEIKRLKPQWRTAFILNRYKHMSYRQIAEIMGVSHRQVEAFIARSMLRLRECIDNADHKDEVLK